MLELFPNGERGLVGDGKMSATAAAAIAAADAEDVCDKSKVEDEGLLDSPVEVPFVFTFEKLLIPLLPPA